MEQPISITIENLKKTIVGAVNESRLHPFILDSIFKDLSNQMSILYQNQVQKEKQEYEALLASQVQNNTTIADKVTKVVDIDMDESGIDNK